MFFLINLVHFNVFPFTVMTLKYLAYFVHFCGDYRMKAFQTYKFLLVFLFCDIKLLNALSDMNTAHSVVTEKKYKLKKL